MKIFIFIFIFQFITLTGSSALFSQQTSADDYFNQAQKTASEKEKIELLQQAIQIQPQHLEARLELGQLYMKKSQFSKAKEQFSAAALATQDAKALEFLGDAYIRLGQTRDAINAYDTAFKQNTQNSQPYFKIVELQISQQQYDEAETNIKTFIRKFGIKNPDAWYYWGKLNLAKNNLKEAENGFRSALKHAPNHARARLAMTQLERSRKVKEIEKELQKAIESENIDLAIQKIDAIKKQDPAFNPQKWRTEIAKIYFSQANTKLSANDKQEAYQLFLKAREYDANLAGLASRISKLENEFDQSEKLVNYYKAGKNALSQENWTSAIYNFEQIIRIQTDYRDARSLLNTAREKYRAENVPEEIATPETPATKNTAALFEEGLSLCAEKKWDAAIEKFEAVLSINPADNASLGMKGFAEGSKLLDSTAWSAAQTKFTNALESLPQNEELQAAKFYAEARIALEAQETETARQKFLAIQKLGIQFRDTQKLLTGLMKSKPAETRVLDLLKAYAPYILGLFLVIVLSLIWMLARKKRTQQPAESITRTPAAVKPRRSSEAIKTVTKVSKAKPAEEEPVFLEDIEEQEVLVNDEPTATSEQETLVAGAGTPPKRHQGRYEMKGEIGRGAMGKVYRAYDHKMERMIVLKEIRMDKAHDHEAYDKLKKRFLREARSAGRLHHANIVTVFDIINQGNKLYISMEYLDGVNLLKYLQKHKIVEPTKAAQIVYQACQALYYAHQAGIVHRDIKPSNLMIQHDGQVKIVDFGVAKDTDSTTLTLVGSSLGTPSYMSPEQIEGKNVDGRSDIFSLGVVFYEMVTGERPFKGETMASIIIKIIQSKPKRITSIKKTLPAELEMIILKMLEKDPEKRYESALEVANALEESKMV